MQGYVYTFPLKIKHTIDCCGFLPRINHLKRHSSGWPSVDARVDECEQLWLQGDEKAWGQGSRELLINTSLQTFFLIFFLSRSLVDLFYTWQKINTPLMLKTSTFYLSKNCFPIFTILLLSLIYKAIANSKFILILRRKFVWFGRNKFRPQSFTASYHLNTKQQNEKKLFSY